MLEGGFVRCLEASCDVTWSARGSKGSWCGSRMSRDVEEARGLAGCQGSDGAIVAG